MRHDNYGDNDRGHETGSIGAGLGRFSKLLQRMRATNGSDISPARVTCGFPIGCHLRNYCARTLNT